MNHRLVSVQDRRRGAIIGAQRLALVGGQPSEPPRRKPRAVAISHAPNRSCLTAKIRLTKPKDCPQLPANNLASPGSVKSKFEQQPLRSEIPIAVIVN